MSASTRAVLSCTASGLDGHDPGFKSDCTRTRPSWISSEPGTCFPSSRGPEGGHPSGRPGHLTPGQGGLGAARGGGSGGPPSGSHTPGEKKNLALEKLHSPPRSGKAAGSVGAPWGPRGVRHRCRQVAGRLPERGQPAGSSPAPRSGARRSFPGWCLYRGRDKRLFFSPFYFNKDIPRHYLQARIIYLCYLAKQLRKRK